MLNVQTKELRTFEVSDATIDRLVGEACDLFDTYGHLYKREAVRNLIKTAIERKTKELIPLLQNVEGWDPENLHVHLFEELDLQKDKGFVRTFFNNMKREWGNKKRILVEAEKDGHTYGEWKARRENLHSIFRFFCDHVNLSGSNTFTSIVNENNYAETRFGGLTYDEIVAELRKSVEILDGMPGGYTAESMGRWENFENFCNHFMYEMEEKISDSTATYVNALFPDIRAREGQPTTRIVRKFFDHYPEAKEMTEIVSMPDRDENGTIIRNESGQIAGYHNEEVKTFNKRMVEYCECVKPIKAKRHFIVSVNPIDFLTMSFGNSWASCHTIDKRNLRKRGDHYNGMYCGGTLSYMLDETTAICYTVDKDYAGDKFELQDKIDRNLIHYHDGVFIQGRLYPQSNDGSSGNTLYKQFRSIEERVIAEGLGAPNIWKYNKGTESNKKYRTTTLHSVHYKDYDNYDTTGVCRINVADGVVRGDAADPNGGYEKIKIGAVGIDIYTGSPVSISGALTAVFERYGRYCVYDYHECIIYLDHAVYNDEYNGYEEIVRAA